MSTASRRCADPSKFMPVQKIDLHTHILPERWPDWTAKSGYAGWVELAHDAPGCAAGCARMQRSEADGSRTSFRDVRANLWSPGRDLRNARRGVALQALSTVPVNVLVLAKATDTFDLARLLNDHIAGVVSAHPKNFVGLGTLPMQDASLAVRELERCTRELGFPAFKSAATSTA